MARKHEVFPPTNIPKIKLGIRFLDHPVCIHVCPCVTLFCYYIILYFSNFIRDLFRVFSVLMLNLFVVAPLI